MVSLKVLFSFFSSITVVLCISKVDMDREIVNSKKQEIQKINPIDILQQAIDKNKLDFMHLDDKNEITKLKNAHVETVIFDVENDESPAKINNYLKEKGIDDKTNMEIDKKLICMFIKNIEKYYENLKKLKLNPDVDINLSTILQINTESGENIRKMEADPAYDEKLKYINIIREIIDELKNKDMHIMYLIKCLKESNENYNIEQNIQKYN